MCAQRNAVVLLSGGLDSATCLAIARAEGFRCHALTFKYGQRHQHELACARKLAAALEVARHAVVEFDLRQFGGSALTGDLPVPKGRPMPSIAEQIPVTYVPARNTIFLSFALALAETTDSQDIFIGVNALDYSGYPDCRPEYISAFETMANLGTRAGVRGQRFAIRTPLIAMTKAQIIRRGIELGLDYSMTSTCYDPAADGTACGQCDACQLRLKGFAECGIRDPARYQSGPAG